MEFKINKLVTSKLANLRLAQGEHSRRVRLAVMLAVTLSSCVTDTLHRTPHPDRGAVRLTVEATDDARGGDAGEAYFARVDDATEGITAGGGVLGKLFAPGEHELLAHNAPAGVTIDGTVATVETLPGGTLNPGPGILRFNTTRINVPADDTLVVSLPLPCRTRRLTLEMEVKGDNRGIIASTDAELTGVAPALDMSAGKLQGTAATVKPVFYNTLTPAEGNVGSKFLLTAEVNLLGIVEGSRQVFTLVITAKSGQTQTISLDMTDVLAGFNSSREPMVLDSDLRLMNEGEFGFNITGWEDGGTGKEDAI